MNVNLKLQARDAGGQKSSFPRPVSADDLAPNPNRGPGPLALPRIKPSEPAADLIRAALRVALARMNSADPEARRGDVEGIHRLRTSTRRLRSELQSVRTLVDRGWREQLESELKWLASLLGNVRDLDILRERLYAARLQTIGDQGPEDTPIAAGEGSLRPLFESLHDRHRRNAQTLRDALQSERYRDLMNDLEATSAHPPVKGDAEGPCRLILPGLAAKAWKRLAKGARALKATDADPAFHAVRKLAKRARYTAELIAPALGRHASQESRRFLRLTIRLQDNLGEHQDAIVAIHEIEQFLKAHPQGDAFAEAAHLLLESQRQAAQAARDMFFDIWRKLDRKKSLRWFKVKQRNIG